MKLTPSVISKIVEVFGDFDICEDWKGSVHIRFGYWKQVNVDELQKLLPDPIVVVQDTIWDDDCGVLFSYEIR